MNAQQLAAASAPNGYTQIIAGPGTGKTFTLVRRIIALLDRGIEPRKIVVVTFTRAAAREILERTNEATRERSNIIVGTFHSVALRFLRRYGGEGYRKLSVIDEHDKADVLRRLISVKGTDVRRLSKEISAIKSRGGLSCGDSAVGDIYEEYEQQLVRLRKVDFDGLLLHFRNFLEEGEVAKTAVDAVLVDEFQDTSALQLEIALLLARGCKNLTVVGDPDQSIYGFRDASPRNFSEMARKVKSRVWYLEHNYRSDQAILTAASRVIQRSSNRIAADRRLLSTKPKTNAEVQFVRLMSPEDEARAVMASIRFLVDSGLNRDEICVLSRYTSKFQSLEAELVSSGMPYRMTGGRRLAEQREVRLLMDYIRVVLDSDDSLAIERTVNNPRRGLGEKSLNQIRTSAGLLTLRRIRSLGSEPAIAYTKIIDAVRELIVPVPRHDISAAIKQAGTIVDTLASALFGTKDAQHDSQVQFIKGALQQFWAYFEDVEEEDDRSFLEAFVDQWSLGADANSSSSDTDDYKGKITLSTIHSAKGLEWPAVLMIDVSEDTPVHGIKRDIEEDLRLLYVAVTRAKSLLVISNASRQADFDSALQVPKSAVRTEVITPDMESLSACVGRELEKGIEVPRHRSVLSKSKRFRATAPVELPEGFKLASELVEPMKPPSRVSERPKAYVGMQGQPRKAANTDHVTARPGTTMLSLWLQSKKT